MDLWPISVVSLSIVAALCIVGTLAPGYNDNLAQRIGMAVLCYGCASRVQHILSSQFVAPDWVAVHVGLAVYGLGTGWKHWRKCRCRKATS